MSTQPFGQRMLWFFGLWVGGVATVAVIGMAIKLVLGH